MKLPPHNIYASPFGCPRCLIILGGYFGAVIIVCVSIAVAYFRF